MIMNISLGFLFEVLLLLHDLFSRHMESLGPLSLCDFQLSILRAPLYYTCNSRLANPELVSYNFLVDDISDLLLYLEFKSSTKFERKLVSVNTEYIL